MLIKTGAGSLGANPSLVQTAIGILTTLPLFIGYSMYGVSMVLLVLALKDGELSAVYPVFALTFVWVTILSITVFHEKLNSWKIAGIVMIVFGVATLGRGKK